MKTLYSLIVLVLLSTIVNAQPDTKTTGNKTLYGEIGGPSGLISANFDTRFTRKPTGLGLRVGLGFAPAFDGPVMSVPMGLNFLAGKNKHFFEAEGGISFYYLFVNGADDPYNTDPSSEWAQYLYVGYRYKSQDGFTARIGFCPVFAEGGSVPWVGLSIGHSF
jgi:hypothetical protein